MNGDGNNNAAQVFTVGSRPISGTAGALSYDALVDFWSQFAPYAHEHLLVVGRRDGGHAQAQGDAERP